MAHNDGSPRLSLEQQLAMLKDRLNQSQKMAALGQLLGTTTHEFNNVLMTIINYAKMGLRHKDEATRDKALEKILSAGQRAAKITNSILATARNRSTDLERTDLAKLVDESLLLLERELRKYRIAVDWSFDPVPQVMANGNQIQQVLLNLIINARQAMPNGGSITIRLAHDKTEQTVDLLVRDTGCGMPQETLHRIFDAYFTTKKRPDESGKGGTGLGLSACREIIESHKGRIRVESTVGRGTAFMIKLPALTKTALDARSQPAPASAHPSFGPTTNQHT